MVAHSLTNPCSFIIITRVALKPVSSLYSRYRHSDQKNVAIRLTIE